MFKPGDVIGHFEIRGFLGQGGMGQVYRAFDPRLERTVALKVIAVPEHTAPSDSGRLLGELAQRLQREAKAVAQLNHPNVVAIFDVGQSDGRFFLAMEYVVGSTLRGLALEEVPLARKIRWLVDVARALDAAHRAGLVHRDVKPENVMVRDDGVVKVLDFGIARRTVNQGSDQAAIDTVTGSGSIAGTPVYMAPEQIKGKEVDARCDQFAWGVMAYEIIVGQRPWSDDGDLLALVARVMTDPVTPIRDRVKDVPTTVDETILRALSRDPSARFSQMADLADALEPFAVQTTGGDRVKVAPPSNPKSSDPSAFAATTRVPTSVSIRPDPSAPTESAKVEAPRRKLARLAVPLALLAALSGVVVWAVKKRPHGPLTTTAARPLSTVPEAEAAYREGMRLWHDGAQSKADVALRKAVDLDPTFAAAHLQIALQNLESEPPRAQAAFQKAFEFQHMLTERDAALLSASEPLANTHPSIPAWEAGLSGYLVRYSRDPELQYWLGHARDRQGNDEDAKTAFGHAVALDPRFMPAVAALGNAERNLGHMKEAENIVNACVTPLATVCRETRWRIFSEAGQCHKARTEAEEWRQLDPGASLALLAVARALHADGAQRASVEEVLAARWRSITPPERRPRLEAWDRMLLATIDGDFDKADQLGKDSEAALESGADRDDHADPARYRIAVLVEVDRLKDAAKVARDYLDRMDAWPSYPFAPDASILFYEPLVRTGQMTRQAFDERRQKWLATERVRQSGDENAAMNTATRGSWIAWSFAWGAFAETREEAQEALLNVPTEPLPMGGRRPNALDFNLGKVYTLAGRANDAVPHLERVTTSCASLDGTMMLQRARWFLGQAYESRGEPDKARAAYEAILATWPKTSGSKTRALAEKRLASLR